MEVSVRRHLRHKPKGGFTSVRHHYRSLLHGKREVRMTEYRRVPVHGFSRTGEPFPRGEKVFKLPVRTAVLVPSTMAHDKPIGKVAFRYRVDEARRFLSKTNGGYTSWEAKGGYTAKDGTLIKEDVGEVVSYATLKDYLRNRPKVEHFLKVEGRKWGQESMGYEVGSQLYYLPSEEKT